MTTANERFSHSDMKYNCLIGSTPDVIGELHLDGTISFISQQVHNMLGYHPDEMIGTNIIKLTHPDDVPAITKVLKKAIKSKQVVIPQLSLKHKQGNYVLVFIKGKLIKLTDKPRLIGVIRDITKIYETEKKLEESQNIFEKLNEVFLKFKEDPIFNLQLLINTAGLLLNVDYAFFNIFKRVNGKNVLESLVNYNEPPNFTRESDPKGHICTDIIKDNPDDVVVLRNLDKTDYMKTDENVRKYNLKQYASYVVKFNNKPTATFCVVYTENREMSNNDINILRILSKSASTEFARWNSQIELQESEEKYRSLVEGLDEALYRMSLPDGNYTYFSPAAKQVFGYSSKDFLDNSMFIKNILHPDFIDYFNEKWADLLKCNVPRTYEYKIIDPDNNERWIKQSNKIIFDSDGNFSAIEGLCRNISERKEVGQKLKESEDKYKNLFDQSPFAIVLINLDGSIEDCNAQTKKLLGYTNEEIVGKDFRKLNIFSHDNLPKLARNFKKFIKTGVLEPSDFQIYKKDGTSAWIHSNPSVIKIAGNSYVIATLQDLTSLKKSEEKIRYQAKLIESVSDAIISTDIDFNILSWNNAAENIYGWSAKEVIGKNFYDIIWSEYPYDDEKTVLETFFREGFWQGEVIHTRKDNLKIQIYSSVNLLKDAIGNPIGAVAINHDISELKKTEEKFKESEEKFRNITEQNLMGIGILQDNTLKYINNAMADIYGYSVEEVLNWEPMEFFKIFAPDTLEIAREQGLKKQTGDPTQVIHYVVHGVKKTGELIWVDNFSITITFEGRPADLVSQIDITEKVGSEKKLKESESKFRKAVENSPDYILFINHKGIIIDVNRLEKGFVKNLVLGQSVFNETFYKKKSQCESVRKAINDSIIHNKTTSYEYSQLAPDGTLSFYETKVSPFEHDKENKIISLQLATRDITDRRKIEQNLKESEEKYRYFFDNAQVGLYWSRITDGKFIECNNKFAKIVGYDTREECLADYIASEHYMNLKDRDEMLEKIKMDGEIKNYDIQVSKRDWTPYWANISARINLKENRIEGAVTDTTERKNIEKKLKQSEKKFKLLNEELEMLLDNLPGLVFYKDDKNNYIKVNQYVANAHEMTKSELEGVSLFDLYPKEEAQKYFDDDLAVIKSKKPKLGFIEPWDVKEGKRWVNSNKIPLFDENNKCIGIIGFATDVTAQVKAEQKLRKSEEKYRSLVETAEMGLVELDFIENRVTYINPKLLKILEYTRDEFFEEKIFIEIVHPEDLEDLIRSGEDRHVEFRIYTKDQKLRWLSGIRSNQYDKKGKISSVRLWLEGITEKKEIDEIKSDLLTRFSHEFKTPLISIKGFTDLLLSAYKDKMDKKSLSFLNNIKNASERLNTLVNTFIECSHLDRDFSKLELSYENLLTILKRAFRDIEPMAILRNHLIDLNVDEKIMVEIDKEKIYTVISNLILNAIKYTPIGGTILIRSKIEGDFISVSIIDNGIGFTSSEKDKLFKKFGKIERYGHGWDIITDGIGMGLYVSKQIITQHGGKIWVESQGIDRGSTFTFTIPIRKNKNS